MPVFQDVSRDAGCQNALRSMQGRARPPPPLHPHPITHPTKSGTFAALAAMAKALAASLCPPQLSLRPP